MSTRSPVFKERPLPKSKKEAIDLMMENPNLIRRPIMVKGSQVMFGFDKDQYRQALTCASARRAGTIRRARARGTASSIRRRRGRPKGFDELAFYAEHFDTVEVNSTFYGQPRAEVCRGWAERTPGDFEFSVKLYQKFTHPRMFKRAVASERCRTEVRGELADALDALARPNDADLDEFRRGIDPLASTGKLGALLAQFPASFKDTPAVAGLPRRICSARFAGYPGRGRTAAPQLERPPRRHARRS